MRERIDFRHINIADIEDAVRIIRQSFNSQLLLTSIYRCYGIVSYLTNEFNNCYSPYNFYGLYYCNQLIAYSEFKLNKENSTVFLNMIAVDNNLKNKNLGTLLLSNSIKIFKDQGYKFVELDVYTSNITAINWYKKMGFYEEFSQTFSEVLLDKLKIDDTNQEFQIVNYPQTCLTLEKFSFGIVHIKYLNTNINAGIIQDSLILKESLNTNLLFWIGPTIKSFHLKNVYYIGNDITNYLIEKDRINRLKLTIK